MKAAACLVLRSAWRHFSFPLGVAGLLEDILGLDRFRVPLHGSWEIDKK